MVGVALWKKCKIERPLSTLGSLSCLLVVDQELAWMECQRMLQAQGTAKSKSGNYRTLLLLLFGIETGNDKRGT